MCCFSCVSVKTRGGGEKDIKTSGENEIQSYKEMSKRQGSERNEGKVSEKVM